MTPPIPRRLLRSTATVRVPKDSFRAGEYEDPVTIGRVWFEPSAAAGSHGQEPVKGLLVIDPRVSEGAFAIPAGSLVSIDGMVSNAKATSCDAVPSAADVHHWEVVLS